MSPPSATVLHASLILCDSFLRNCWHLVSRPPFELGNLWGNCRVVQRFLSSFCLGGRGMFVVALNFMGPSPKGEILIIVFLSSKGDIPKR